jgi:transposase
MRLSKNPRYLLAITWVYSAGSCSAAAKLLVCSNEPLLFWLDRLLCMVRQLGAEFDTQFLLPPSVEDWVGPRHVARFVREFVRGLDLAELGFTVRVPQVRGRPGYTCELLTSAWVYGYLTKQRSTRSLERACQCDMGAIWLTGNHQPDHSTLHNFFRDHRKAFKKLLRQSALLACRMGLVDMQFVAVDGTKLKASTGGKDAILLKDLEFAVAAIDEQIDKYIAQVDGAGDLPCAQLPESLSDVKKLREAIARDLAELKELGASQLSPVDPDARVMQTRDGLRPAYNAQAAVDSKSGIVLAASVSLNASDAGLLDAVIDQVEEDIGVRPDLTAADSGYFSAAQMQLAQDKGRALAVSMRGREPGKDEPLHSWLFVHDTQRNILVCPIGGELSFRGPRKAHSSKDPVDRYSCDDYKDCPFAKQCSKSPRGRQVEVGLHRDAALGQWERQKNLEHPEKMKKRSAVVERIFGHVKRNLGLRHLDHRTLETVQAVWATILAVTNLRTIYKHWKLAA